MGTGKLDLDDIYALPESSSDYYPVLFNPEDISRWLARPTDEVVWEIRVEIMQQYAFIRGLAKLMYEFPDAETMIVARAGNNQATLKEFSEMIIFSTNIIRRIIDMAASYSEELKKQNENE